MIAKGYSLLVLQAYSVGDTSPNLKSPRLFTNEKLFANPDVNGSIMLPSPSTGIWPIMLGRLYLS